MFEAHLFFTTGVSFSPDLWVEGEGVGVALDFQSVCLFLQGNPNVSNNSIS